MHQAEAEPRVWSLDLQASQPEPRPRDFPLQSKRITFIRDILVFNKFYERFYVVN